MKGLQITAPGQFQIVEVPDPEPEPDEILIKVHVCNSCTHWDLSIWEGYDIFSRPGHAPSYPYGIGAPGHEWAGEVVAVGDQVRGIRVGDRVSTGGSGDPRPPSRGGRDGQERRPRPSGRPRYGSYVQYLISRPEAVQVYPREGLSWGEIAMQEMLGCVGQGIVTAGDFTRQRVAVFGMGAAGLMMMQAARFMGPASVTAVDVDPARCEIAASLGADRTIQPGSEAWNDLAEDEFTISIDCSGSPKAIESALEHTAGKMVIFSVPSGPFLTPTSTRRTATSIPYTRTPNGRTSRFARNLLVSGQVNVKPLLTHELPLEQFDRGVELLKKKEAIKVSFTLW
ncbi:MAG TPA: zinc-binding dehydrogenase [Chloroflexota bacterium]|nr:zinc-binding dehydrogenase [Chloroflexota bacterium]